MSAIKAIEITIDKKISEYYQVKDIQAAKPEYFYGFTSRPRQIVKRKNIPESDVIYAYERGSDWIVSTESYRKAQLMISKSWSDKNIFKMAQAVKVTEHTPEEKKIQQDDQELELGTPEVAPEILLLEDEEKFCDANGTRYEIECRGTKDAKGLYFKAKDIEKAFGAKRIRDTIMKKECGFECYKHYKVFFINTNNNIVSTHVFKKGLFLTYRGLLRYLFVSRSPKAEEFQDWAEKILFTVQMGSSEEKERLGTKILDIDIRTFRSVFNKHASKFPCVYLIRIGTAKDHRNSLAIPQSVTDDKIIYKYGFSCDFDRRLREHTKKYGANIEVEAYHMIDPIYTSDAEKRLRDFFDAYNHHLPIPGQKELVSFSEKELEYAKTQYSYIGSSFSGHTSEMQSKINSLEREIDKQKLEKEKIYSESQLAIERERHEKALLNNERMCQVFELERKNYELQIQLLRLQNK